MCCLLPMHIAEYMRVVRLRWLIDAFSHQAKHEDWLIVNLLVFKSLKALKPSVWSLQQDGHCAVCLFVDLCLLSELICFIPADQSLCCTSFFYHYHEKRTCAKTTLNPFTTLIIFFPDVEKDDEASIASATNESGQQGAPAPETCIETTVPKLGQNLW